ncbi:peritrophin-1-like [Argopecten irradians]|uniref:peritrophin-1-like n=1 Tax=Argopecten irradians TaxID=31199 RepID=UPI003719CBBF
MVRNQLIAVKPASFILLFCLGCMICHVTSEPAPPGFCTGKPDGGYRHPDSCGEYIKCSNGITHVQECPVNLLWNDSNDRCEFVSDDPNCKVPLHFSCVGRDDGNYAYPGDCTRFYMCSNQIKWALHCPSPLHFDPILQDCNHQIAANCVL